MKFIKKELEASNADVTLVAAEKTRFGRNMKIYLASGSDAEIYVPNTADLKDGAANGSDSDDEQPEGKTKLGKRKAGKLAPLSYPSLWGILTFNRKTQTGLKIRFVALRSCDPCRELPLFEKKVVTLTQHLETSREQGQPSVELTKQLGEAKAKLDRLRTHAEWLKIQRPYVDNIKEQLRWGNLPATCLAIQDFVKFYASDSRANKTLVMAIFANVPADAACGEDVIDWIDNWFRGSSCAETTVRVWEFLLAKTDCFNAFDKIVIASDTGNGNLSYVILYFLSCCWSRYRKEMELALYCPRHGESDADRHGGHLAVKVDAIKTDGQITELSEFAEVSQQIVNTLAFVHDEGLDDLKATGLDPAIHLPIPTLRPFKGLRQVGNAQFRWKLLDGSMFSQDGVIRVQKLSGEDKWVVHDLDASRPVFCSPCTARARCPQRHELDVCPFQRNQKKHISAKGIQVAKAPPRSSEPWICPACGSEFKTGEHSKRAEKHREQTCRGSGMDKAPANGTRKRNRKPSSGDSSSDSGGGGDSGSDRGSDRGGDSDGDSGRDSGDAGSQVNEPKRRRKERVDRANADDDVFHPRMQRVDGPNADDDVFHPNPT